MRKKQRRTKIEMVKKVLQATETKQDLNRNSKKSPTNNRNKVGLKRKQQKKSYKQQKQRRTKIEMVKKVLQALEIKWDLNRNTKKSPTNNKIEQDFLYITNLVLYIT